MACLALKPVQGEFSAYGRFHLSIYTNEIFLPKLLYIPSLTNIINNNILLY